MNKEVPSSIESLCEKWADVSQVSSSITKLQVSHLNS